MADKQKDFNDILLSGALAAPAYYGLIKTAPEIMAAVGNAEFAGSLRANPVKAVRELIESFIDRPEGAAYTRKADKHMARFAKSAMEYAGASRSSIVDKAREANLNVTKQKLGLKTLDLSSRSLEQFEFLSQLVAKDFKISETGGDILDQYKEQFEHFKMGGMASDAVMHPELIQTQAMLSYTSAYTTIYGHTPASRLPMGVFTYNNIRANSPEISKSFQQTRMAAERGDKEARQVMFRMNKSLRSLNTDLKVSASQTNLTLSLKGSDTIKVGALGRPNMNIRSADDMTAFLMQQTSNENPLKQMQRDLYKKLMRSIGLSSVYSQFDDPAIRAQRLYKFIDQINKKLQYYVSTSGSMAEAFNLNEKATAQLKNVFRSLSDLRITGHTFENNGMLQQSLGFKINVGSKGTAKWVSAIESEIPIAIMGIFSPDSNSSPMVSMLRSRMGLESATTNGLMDVTEDIMSDIERNIQHIVRDVIDKKGSTRKAQSYLNKLIRTRMGALSRPMQYNARDVSGRLIVVDDTLDYHLGNARMEDYRRIQEGKRGLQLMKSGGLGFLFDTEYVTGAADSAAGLQRVARDPTTELYNAGVMAIDMATGDIEAMHEFWAKPKGFSSTNVDLKSGKVISWLKQHGIKDQELTDMVARIESAPDSDVTVKNVLLTMKQISEAVDSRNSTLKGVAYITHAGLEADLPIMRRNLLQGNIKDSKLRATMGRMFDRIFAGMTNESMRADVMAPDFSHINIQSVFRLLNPSRLKSESQEEIFKDLYSLRSKDFGSLVDNLRSGKSINEAVKTTFANQGSMIDERKSAKNLAQIMRQKKMIERFGGAGKAHASGLFDTLLMYFNYTALQKQYRGLDSKQLAEIDRLVATSDTMLDGKMSWARPQEVINKHRRLFQSLETWELNGAVPMNNGVIGSVLGVSKSQAARLRRTLYPLEATTPFGMLNNFAREKHQALAGRILNPLTNEVLGKNANAVYGHGSLIETEASNLLKLFTGIRHISDTDDPKSQPWIDRAVRAAKLSGMRQAGSSLYSAVINSLDPANRTPHTHLMTVVSLMPEDFHLVAEGGAIINEAIMPGLATYSGTKPVHAKFEVRLAEVAGTLKNATTVKQKSLEQIRAALKEVPFHKSIVNAMNRADATAAIRPTSKGFEFLLNSKDEAWRIVNDWISGKQQINRDTALLPSDFLISASEKRMTPDSMLDGSSIGNTGGGQYKSNIPGVPERISYDVKNDRITVHVHQHIPGTTGIKLIVGGDGKWLKVTGTSLASSVEGRRALQMDSLSQIAVGNKLGGKRNELGAVLSAQIGRVQLKHALDPNMRLADQKTAMIKAYTKLFGDDKIVKMIKWEMGNIQIHGRSVPIIKAVIPNRVEAVIKGHLTLNVLEDMLQEQGVDYNWVKEQFELEYRNMWKKNATNQYPQAINKERAVYASLVAEATKNQDGSAGGAAELKHLMRINENLRHANFGKKAALFDIMPFREGSESVVMAVMRTITSVSVSDSQVDFFMRFARHETKAGLPGATPRASGLFMTILMDSFERFAFNGSETTEQLMGANSARVGLNYTNRFGRNPVADAQKDMALIRNFYYHGSNELKKLEHRKPLSIKDLYKEMNSLKEISTEMDFSSSKWRNLDAGQLRDALADEFLITSQSDPQLIQLLEAAAMENAEINAIDPNWADESNLFGKRHGQPGTGRRIETVTMPLLDDLIDYGTMEDATRSEFKRKLIEQLKSHNVLNEAERVVIPFNTVRVLQNLANRPGFTDTLDGKKLDKIIGALSTKVGAEETIHLLDEIPFFSFIGNNAAYESAETGKYLLGGGAGAQLKMLHNIANVLGVTEGLPDHLTSDNMDQTVKQITDRLVAKVSAVRRDIEVNQPITMGSLAGLVSSQKLMGTMQMAYGKLNSSHNLVGALQWFVNNQDMNKTSHNLPKEIAKLVRDGATKTNIGQWKTNLELDHGPISVVGGKRLLTAKGFGVNESPMFFSTAVNMAETLVKDKDMTPEQASDWLFGKISWANAKDRSSTMQQGMILAGNFWVYPDELAGQNDTLDAMFYKRAAMFMDPIAMKFSHGDQDGDTAAILNISGRLRGKDGKIVTNNDAAARLAKDHTKFLTQWHRWNSRRNPDVFPGKKDIFTGKLVDFGDRILYQMTDKADDVFLQSDPYDILTKSLMRDEVASHSIDSVEAQLGYLIQRTFTGVIGGYQKSAMGMAYAGVDSVWHQLGELVKDERGPGAQFFNASVISQGITGDHFGATRSPSMEFRNALKRMTTRSNLVPREFGWTPGHLVNTTIAMMSQDSAIDKTAGNPVQKLFAMMTNLNNLSYAKGDKEAQASIEWLATNQDGWSLMDVLRDRPYDQMTDQETGKLRAASMQMAADWHTLSLGVQVGAEAFEQLQFKDITGFADFVKTTASLKDLARKTGKVDIEAAEAILMTDNAFVLGLNRLVTPAMHRAGLGLEEGSTLFRLMGADITDSASFKKVNLGRILKEELGSFTKQAFKFIDASIGRKYGKRFGLALIGADFMDPNTGSMVIGETEGYGGEDNDIPSSSELMRAYRNRKIVRTREESPDLKDRMTAALHMKPQHEQRYVRGMALPEPPTVYYDDKRKRHTEFNVRDYLRRAEAILL